LAAAGHGSQEARQAACLAADPSLTQRRTTKDALVDAAMEVIGIALDYDDALPASAR
jgi:hypothetical protein